MELSLFGRAQTPEQRVTLAWTTEQPQTRRGVTISHGLVSWVSGLKGYSLHPTMRSPAVRTGETVIVVVAVYDCLAEFHRTRGQGSLTQYSDLRFQVLMI